MVKSSKEDQQKLPKDQNLKDQQQRIIEQQEQQESFEQQQRVYFGRYCENCLQKQSQHLKKTFAELYTIEFFRCRSGEIINRRKFRRVMVCQKNTTSFWLCQECNNCLVLENNIFTSKNIWPAFIYSTLANEKVMNVYGIKVWQLIPTLWRHWWIDNIRAFFNYLNVTLEYPRCIIIDRSPEKRRMDIKHGSSIATAYSVILQHIYATLCLMPVGIYQVCVQLQSCFTGHRISTFPSKSKH